MKAIRVISLLAVVLAAVPSLRADAISDLTAKATDGDAAAQYELADRLAKGDGVPKDAGEATKWYAKSGEQGNVAAQMKLGTLYIAGKQVRKDSSTAAMWFMLAADAGNAAAQTQIARMHMGGVGVAKDDVEAYKWATAAVAGGDVASKQIVQVLEKRMKPEQLTFARSQAQAFIALKKTEAELALPPPPPDTPAVPEVLAPPISE